MEIWNIHVRQTESGINVTIAPMKKINVEYLESGKRYGSFNAVWLDV